jgi:hypothetical protein
MKMDNKMIVEEEFLLKNVKIFIRLFFEGLKRHFKKLNCKNKILLLFKICCLQN